MKTRLSNVTATVRNKDKITLYILSYMYIPKLYYPLV